jgi:tetratricopeptide (TPR) repeat protein/DNA-binding winged helix-turn-helix (wHTH) protein/TolB-like protein
MSDPEQSFTAPRDYTYRIGDAYVSVPERWIRRGSDPVGRLRPKSFDLLLLLIETRGRIATKDEIIGRLWADTAVTDNSLVQCVIELRKVLGSGAIKTIPKVGYQLASNVETAVPPKPSLELESTTTVEVDYSEELTMEPPPALPAVGRSSKRMVTALSLGVISVAVVLVLLVFRRPVPLTTLPQIAGNHPVLVLFFENQSRTPELDWLREGLADMMIADLSRVPKVNVLSREQVAALASRAGWKPGTVPRLEATMALAARARAQVLLMGKFGKFGDEIRIMVQVHRASDGSLLRSETATAGRMEQVIGQMGLLSAKISRELTGSLPDDGQQTASPPITSNLDAYRAYSLGVRQVSLLNLPEGTRLLKEAVELDPQFAAAYAELGHAYSVIWNVPQEGNRYLQEAFSLSSRLTERHRLYLAAWYALANNDFSEAIRAYRQIAVRFPYDAEAFHSLGRLLEGEGQYDQAIDVERQGLTADPDDPLLQNFLARVYCRAGRFNEALAASRRYVELTGGEPNALDSLGTTYMWQGKYAEAEKAYRDALQRKPDFDIALVHLAAVHYREGRYREVMAECDRYLQLVSQDLDKARGYAWQSWIHLRRGELAEARETAAREVAVASPLAFLSASLIAIRSGNVEPARHLVETAPIVPERGNRGTSRYRLYARGKVALAEGDKDEAIASFQRALQQPEPVGFIDFLDDCLADGYLQLGRFKEAIAEYGRVLRRNPNDAMARYHLAEAFSLKGDGAAAREEYRRFLEIWENADSELREVKIARAALR